MDEDDMDSSNWPEVTYSQLVIIKSWCNDGDMSSLTQQFIEWYHTLHIASYDMYVSEMCMVLNWVNCKSVDPDNLWPLGP